MSKTHSFGRKSDGGAFALRMADVFKLTRGASINGAAGTAVWAPATGKRVRLMGAIVNGATAGDVTFYDGSTATPIAVVGIAANQSTAVYFDQGIPLTVSQNLLVIGPAGLSNVNAFGVEEIPSPD